MSLFTKIPPFWRRPLALLAVPFGAPQPFGLSAPLLWIGFTLAALGGCLDTTIGSIPVAHLPIADLHLWFSAVFLACMALTDREGSLATRLKLTLTGLLASVALAYLFHAVSPAVSLHKLNGVIFHGPVIVFWALALWLATPILACPPWVACRSSAPGAPYSRLFRSAVWALALYGAFCFASAAVSPRLRDSFELFLYERALPLALVFAWLRAAQAVPGLRERNGRIIMGFLLVMTLLGLGVGLADLWGGRPLQHWLIAHRLIYVDPLCPPSLKCEHRLLFPMLDFNRAGYYAMVALLALLVAFSAARRRLICYAFPPLAAVLLFTIVLTYTRTTLVAALGALALWAALISRRALILLVAGAVVLVLLLPAERRRHIMTIFQRSTYNPQAPGPMTSMRARRLGWNFGLKVIASKPLTGMGYGARIVRDAYIRYGQAVQDPRILNDIKASRPLRHLHNLWLETAAESGLPALAALLAFLTLRWLMLARNFRRATGPARRRVAAWIAFEAALVIAGINLYMIKQNFGLLTWLAWAYALSEAETMRGDEVA